MTRLKQDADPIMEPLFVREYEYVTPSRNCAARERDGITVTGRDFTALKQVTTDLIYKGIMTPYKIFIKHILSILRYNRPDLQRDYDAG